LQANGVELEFRDLTKDPLCVAELDKLISDRDYKLFLNPRNDLYRKRNMKDHPPSRIEALKLMAAEPNLIRGPVVIRGSKIVLGFDEKALKELL
jgi:arsenate reductase-like glutaredoxin family protein